MKIKLIPTAEKVEIGILGAYHLKMPSSISSGRSDSKIQRSLRGMLLLALSRIS